jgi:hypothetical protein
MLVLAPEAARAGLWAVVDVTRASARDNFALSMAQALEPLLSGAFPRALRGLTIYGPAPRVGNGWLTTARLLVPRFLAGGAEAVSYADAAEHSVWSDARLCALLRIPVPVEARWRALAVAFVSHTNMARTASASTLAPSRAPSALSRTASLLSRAGSGALVLSRAPSRFSRPRHAPRLPPAPRPPRASRAGALTRRAARAARSWGACRRPGPPRDRCRRHASGKVVEPRPRRALGSRHPRRRAARRTAQRTARRGGARPRGGLCAEADGH